MTRKSGLCVLFLVAAIDASSTASGSEIATPRFAEETAKAGIESVYTGDWEYMVGGGAAAFDCNGDGFDDLFLAGGAAPAKFFVNRSKAGGELTFVPEASGLERDAVTGAYPARHRQ